MFIDNEEMASERLREHLPSLPEELQFLRKKISLAIDESNSTIAEWIEKIIKEVELKKV